MYYFLFCTHESKAKMKKTKQKKEKKKGEIF